VLLVEDQNSVRAVVAQALKAHGFRVIEVGRGEDALRAADALPEPVDALVTDVMMPQMSGPVLAEQLRQVWPGLRVLFMSGFTYSLTPTFLHPPGTAFIQKPFVPDVLAAHLRKLLDRSI
jgi:DNA-binding response OmpR family regulator